MTFYPDNKSVEVIKDTSILSAAISAGIYLKSSCGGDGVCGQCKVILKKGKVLSQPTGRLNPEERQRGMHLACLCEIQSDIEVDVPEESKLDFNKLSPQELELRLKGIFSEPEDVEAGVPGLKEPVFTHSPLAQKLYLELPPPNLEDKVSDLERLHRQIRRALNKPLMPNITSSNLANIRILSELLRDSEWKITVTIGQRTDANEILAIQPQDTSSKNFGFCFDIGTTTLSGQLVDLKTKKILGTKAAYNKQASFGSDVITRIIYAREQDGLEKLHHAVVDEMNEMIRELVAENNIDLNDVNCITCAGNTTMIHLLLRIDPTYIRREPYVPTANFIPVVKAAEAGLKINPHGILSLAPGVSSYVGGDITAGILSCGMDKEEELCMLIDIGTNGEIALGNKEFLVTCAASAGPAFEGSGVTCGMRAAKGAIQKAKINPKDFSVEFSTIGGSLPIGICGSGYIDLISEMLKTGLIDKSGKIKIELPGLVRNTESGKEFLVVEKSRSANQAEIVITEDDIENIKRAKAAIYSAAAVLVRHMGFGFHDLKKIFIAGGFGTFLDMKKAIRIGLLPDLERNRFIFVGNSSLAGARSMLLSIDAFTESEKIAQMMTYLELSVEPTYMDEYIAALFFPHTDLNRFPSLKL